MTEFRTDVALSRVQNVYAVPQPRSGEIAFPDAGHLVLPTGDAVANQSTPVTDSREKADTLDVRNVFQGVASPATVDMSMYLRTAGLDVAPQGEVLLIALQGARPEPATGVLAASLADNAATVELKTVTGVFPQRGVVAVEGELIHYRTVSETMGALRLTDLTRGYRGTTPVSHAADTDVTLKSRWYGQSTHRPECTLWVQTDSILQCVEGCRITEASLALATSDAVELRFSITGRRLWNAGQSPLAQNAAADDTVLTVKNSRVFFAGQKIRAVGREGAYGVTAVDETAGTLTLDSPLAEAWQEGDVITWWLPGGDPIGREVENRDTTMRVAGERGAMLPGTIKIGTPVSFTEEVGDRFPGQAIDDTRSCTIDYNVLMRKDAAQRLRQGFEGQEVRYDAEFGVEDGFRMALVAPRMKLTTASVGFQAPTVTLSTSGRLLGSGKGENSVQIVLE